MTQSIEEHTQKLPQKHKTPLLEIEHIQQNKTQIHLKSLHQNPPRTDKKKTCLRKNPETLKQKHEAPLGQNEHQSEL